MFMNHIRKLPLPVFVLVCLFLPYRALAVCTTLIKGSVAVDVKQCSEIIPETYFTKGDPKYSFVYDIAPVNRKALMETYRGILIKGRVVRSQAISSGITDEKGALSGDTIDIFIPKGSGTCEQAGELVQGDIEQICCEGGGNSPCLLDAEYVMKAFKPLEKAPQKSLAKERSPEAKAIYADAGKKLKDGDLKGAALSLEKLKTQGQLDVQGQYVLAKTYRDLDRCKNAIPILEQLQKQFESNDYWVESEPFIRGGSILYARCLSRDGNSSEAVLVLQGFLVEPKKYKREIQESLVHPDFGYITTTKAYTKYKASATRALSK
jgi:hypothetical protein